MTSRPVVSNTKEMQLIDAEATAKINQVAAEAVQLQQDHVVLVDSNPIANKKVAHAIEKEFDLEHKQFKKDVAAEKKILSAAKDMESEVYHQKVNQSLCP